MTLFKLRTWRASPGSATSTPSIFKALGLSPGEQLPGPDPLELLRQFTDRSIYEGPFLNDLELPAFEVLPQLRALADDLSSLGFRATMMSGSGTTFFAIGTPGADVEESWRAELEAKHDVDIFEEFFCKRLGDEKLWYAEQPAEAKKAMEGEWVRSPRV